MQLQSISQQGGQSFSGKVYTIDLSKSNKKTVKQVRPFLDKQVENKKYNIYIAQNSFAGQDALRVWTGLSSRPNSNLTVINKYFTQATLVSAVKQSVQKIEAMFGVEQLVKKKSFWSKIFG